MKFMSKHWQVYVGMALAISLVACPEQHIARGSKVALPLSLPALI